MCRCKAAAESGRSYRERGTMTPLEAKEEEVSGVSCGVCRTGGKSYSDILRVMWINDLLLLECAT